MEIIFTLALGFIYCFFIQYFWRQAGLYFDLDNQAQGYWNLFLSALNGAGLGLLLL